MWIDGGWSRRAWLIAALACGWMAGCGDDAEPVTGTTVAGDAGAGLDATAQTDGGNDVAVDTAECGDDA